MDLVLGAYKRWLFLVILILITLESLWSWRTNRKVYDINDTSTNVLILLGRLFFKNYVFASYQLIVISFASKINLFTLPENILTFIFSFLIIDFVYYWYHRLSHCNKFLWAFHMVHHSSSKMNLTTSYRLSWFSFLLSPLLFLPPAILGVPANYIALCYAVNLFYQFFLHTEAIGKLGILEGIIDTPSAHRVHHASNKEYHHKNFGGVLMIWDRLFHTYIPETDKAIFGIKQYTETNNPIVLMTQGFTALFKKKRNLTTILLVLSFSLNAQEICNNAKDDDNDGWIDLNDKECICETKTDKKIISLITNPSFEENNCYPISINGGGSDSVDCWANDWYQASIPTTDYMHMDSYFYSSIPVPFPDGKGAFGIRFWPGWQEYVGANLIHPMKAGTKYTFTFYFTGGKSLHSSNSVILSPIQLTLFGSSSISSFPLNIASCPQGVSGFTKLAEATYIPDNKKWKFITMEFTPNIDVKSIIIGAPCNMPSDYIIENDCYFGIDNLVLNKSILFLNNISIDSTIGSLCDKTKILVAHPSTKNGLYQWYKDGISILNATDTILKVSALNLGEGNYTFRNVIDTSTNDCLISSVNVKREKITVNTSVSQPKGCVPLEANLVASASINGDFKWEISNGDSFTGASANIKVITSGNYDVKLNFTSVGGCTSSVELKNALTVYPLPYVNFTANIYEGCAPLSVNFANNNANIASSQWTFGDGNSSAEKSANNTFLKPGKFDIRLKNVSTDGCTKDSTINEMIEVFNKPAGEINAKVQSTCINSELDFFYSSSDNVVPHWSINQVESSSHIVHQSFSSPGKYDVKLTLTDDKGCKNEIVKKDFITIYENPSADFSISPPITSTLKTKVSITDASTGDIQNWFWSYDNKTNTLQNFHHVFPEKVGTYPIKLVVNDVRNCKDSTIKYLQINEPSHLYIPNAFTPNGDGLNDYFFATGENIELFQMQIFNRWGELIFESKNINEKWDGSYQGERVQEDVYVFKINWGEHDFSTNNTLSGTVSIIK